MLCNHHFWETCVDILSSTYNVITFDFRGHGVTKDTGPYTLEQNARDIKALIEFMNLKDVTLVGWSMGGYSAYKYIELFGANSIIGASIVDIPPKMINEDGWEYGGWTSESFKETIANINTADFDARSGFAVGSFAADNIQSNKILDFTLSSYMMLSTEAFSQYMIELTIPDYRELVKKCPVPLLYIKGEHSPFFPIESSQWMLENMNPLQEIMVEKFDSSGHMVPLEEPHRLCQKIHQFVQKILG